MQVLHAHWQLPQHPDESPGFWFWAENAAAPPPPKIRRGRKAQPHPFCDAPITVLHLLQRLGLSSNLEQCVPQETVLWLPTGKHGPCPSPQLLHDWELEFESDVDLRPWEIEGVKLYAEHAFFLLCQLSHHSEDRLSLVFGPGVRFWHQASSLVLEIMSQQKLLPTIEQPSVLDHLYGTGKGRRRQQGSLYPQWMPVFDTPEDRLRFNALANAMPSICRAESPDPVEAPSSRLWLEHFLQYMSDQLARVWGASSFEIGSHPRNDLGALWLKGLFEEKREVQGTKAQLQRFHQSHEQWFNNLYIAGDARIQIALQLKAPTQQSPNPKAKDWTLHYLLRSRDNPDITIPAEQLWQSNHNVLTLNGETLHNPQETLLKGLGYIAKHFQPLQRGLKQKTPTMMAINTQEAYQLLRTAAPLLRASGFAVIVPPWWGKPETSLGLRLRVEESPAPTMAHLGMQQVLKYHWELAIGDAGVTRKEFQAMLSLKTPLLQVRGNWIQLDPQQVEKALLFLARQQKASGNGNYVSSEITLQDAIKVALNRGQELFGLPIHEVKIDGELGQWMDHLKGTKTLELLDQPSSLQATLRPYQRYGYSWLSFLRSCGIGACLADDMGIGKTIQTISMLLRDREQGWLNGPTLVLCPTSVVLNWAKELERFAPELSFVVHQGAQRLQNKAFVKAAKKTDLVLSSYPLVRRDVEFLRKVQWYGVILDEAQHIKNPEAQQTKAILSLPTMFRLALTGTPIENRLIELWSIMQFLNPGYLGKRKEFRSQYSIPIERYNDQRSLERLKNLVSPFILRREKTDPKVSQDLPEKVEQREYCQLSDEQANLYESTVKEVFKKIEEAREGIERQGLIFSLMTKLKQICNHPILHYKNRHEEGQMETALLRKRSVKLARLTEMLEEVLDLGERALIFTQYAEMGHVLQQYLRHSLGVPVLYLHGGTPSKKRAQMIQQFQKHEDGPPIFILSLKAGGTGLTLTRANHVFHFDRWWNPAVEDQATDRAFRIGQTRNVQVHKFVCVGTMEEQIDQLIERKKGLARSIVSGNGEAWITELSNQELRKIVTLRRVAIQTSSAE